MVSHTTLGYDQYFRVFGADSEGVHCPLLGPVEVHQQLALSGHVGAHCDVAKQGLETAQPFSQGAWQEVPQDVLKHDTIADVVVLEVGLAPGACARGQEAGLAQVHVRADAASEHQHVQLHSDPHPKGEVQPCQQGLKIARALEVQFQCVALEVQGATQRVDLAVPLASLVYA